MPPDLWRVVSCVVTRCLCPKMLSRCSTYTRYWDAKFRCDGPRGAAQDNRRLTIRYRVTWAYEWLSRYLMSYAARFAQRVKSKNFRLSLREFVRGGDIATGRDMLQRKQICSEPVLWRKRSSIINGELARYEVSHITSGAHGFNMLMFIAYNVNCRQLVFWIYDGVNVAVLMSRLVNYV